MKKEPMDLEAIATALRWSIYHAYVNTLIGTTAKKIHDASDRMKQPLVGDWVAEISTMYWFLDPKMTDLDAVGILEEIAQEKAVFGDPEFVWNDEEEGRPHPTERVFYIRTMDGRRFRWVNATIVAALPLPADLPSLNEEAKRIGE